MTEIASPPLESSRHSNFGLLAQTLFSPRRAFARIAGQSGNVWLLPMAVLVLTALLRVLAAGPIKQATALVGPGGPPPEYYSPEQQAQLQQALSATSGPVFVYVFPAIVAVIGVWLGWLLVSGLLHLVLTLLGGRGSTHLSMNLVAWASLPFALRDGVQILYMLASRQLVTHSGLSGFASADSGAMGALIAGLLGFVDVYFIWYVALLAVAVRAANGLSRAKAIGGVLLTVFVVALIQSLPGVLFSGMSQLNIIRPFLF